MILRKEKCTNDKYTTTSNDISSSIKFMKVLLLFNIVDRIKLICISSNKICSFPISKAFLTQFWQLIFGVSNRLLNFLLFLWHKDNLLWVGSLTANLVREFSNVPVLCIWFIFFTFYIFEAGYTQFLKIYNSIFFKWETVWRL